jgi:ubiquinone biosynthesis protein COQ4
MKKESLDPEFFPQLKIDNDDTYIIMRVRQTHDLFHVVTGFKTDPVGEYTLQAFVLCHLALPLAAILLGGALMRSAMSGGDKLDIMSEAIARGASLAAKTRGLFSYDWEANWSKPLVDVRRELHMDVEICGIDLTPIRRLRQSLLNIILFSDLY